MSDSCSGHCCEAFTLTIGGDWIRSMQAWIDQGFESIELTDGSVLSRGDEKYDVPAMVIPLGRHLSNPVSGQKFDEPVELWTCKHFDRESRRCGNYDGRPDMCRKYPSAGCEYKDCSWVGHRAPPALSGLVVI